MDIKYGNVATSFMTTFLIGSTSMLSASSTVPISKPNNYVSSIPLNQNDTKTKTLITPNYLSASNGIQQNSISSAEKEKQGKGFSLIEKELLGYLGLKPNWDNDSARMPEKNVVSESIKFLKKLETLNFPLPIPMLSSDGEICFYWKKKHYYIEIGFEEEGYFSYAIDNYDEPFGEDKLPVSKFYQTRLYAALSTFSPNS